MKSFVFPAFIFVPLMSLLLKARFSRGGVAMEESVTGSTKSGVEGQDPVYGFLLGLSDSIGVSTDMYRTGRNVGSWMISMGADCTHLPKLDSLTQLSKLADIVQALGPLSNLTKLVDILQAIVANGRSAALDAAVLTDINAAVKFVYPYAVAEDSWRAFFAEVHYALHPHAVPAAASDNDGAAVRDKDGSLGL